jgi:hypothetical protein
MGFAGLALALVLALLGGLIVDIPAAALGVKVGSSHIPPGLEIADTAVQDLGFVLAAVLVAGSGARLARTWQFGLRAPRGRWYSSLLGAAGTLLAFYLFLGFWSEALHLHEKEKLLQNLGANEGVILLILSATLTCAIAPVCEEFLFRGFFFRAMSNWRGPWPAALLTGLVFGGVHAGSAPVGDLVPLGFLGFCLCWLYRQTGSLYPGIAVHATNNCIAFAALEHWRASDALLLLAAVLGGLGLLVVALGGLGVLAPEPITAAELALPPLAPPQP